MDDDEVYVRNYDFEEMYAKDPSQPKVRGLDFGKQSERFKTDLRRDLDLEEDMLVVENQLPERVVKNTVKMDKGGPRFPEPTEKDPFIGDKPVTELNIDID